MSITPIIKTDRPTTFVNLVAALVYVIALPFAAVVVTYLYFDLRGRHESASVPEPAPGELLTTT